MVISSIDRIIGEASAVSQLDRDSQSILFDRNYDNSVIFIQPLSYNVTQPAIVRIEDIQIDRTASIQEPRLDGKYKQDFDYISKPRTWRLEDDPVLEVGTVNTDLLAPNPWENIELNYDFADNPLAFSQVQTNSDRDFVPTFQRNSSTNGFQIAEEAFNTTGNGEETVGSMATDNRSDASGLGWDNLDNDWLDIEIEEDPTGDRDYHPNEEINLFAIEGDNILRASNINPQKSFSYESCNKETIVIDSYRSRSPVWTDDRFSGNFCRKITADASHIKLDLEANSGGFDTAIVRTNPAIRVDKLDSNTKVFSAIDINLNGSGKWWIGPKFGVYEDTSNRKLDGNYENYVIENASRSPQEYHERLTRLGEYLGQTNHDGSIYKHYYKEHESWGQFWAIRQNYRETGSVSLKPILNIWRNNGLPNEYIGPMRVNVETSGKISGTVEMFDLNIPSW